MPTPRIKRPLALPLAQRSRGGAGDIRTNLTACMEQLKSVERQVGELESLPGVVTALQQENGRLRAQLSEKNVWERAVRLGQAVPEPPKEEDFMPLPPPEPPGEEEDERPTFRTSFGHCSNRRKIKHTKRDPLVLWERLVSARCAASHLCFVHKSWRDESNFHELAQSLKFVSQARQNSLGSEKSWSDNQLYLEGLTKIRARAGRRGSEAQKSPMRRLMTHPYSPKRAFWDMLGMLVLAHDFFMMPLMVFNDGTGGLPDGYDEFAEMFDWIATPFWTVDIGMSLITGYLSDYGNVVMDPRKVARHYLKGWACLDFAIIFLDWVSLCSDSFADTGSLMHLGKTFSRLTRVLRLLRFMKMSGSLKSLMERVNSEYILTIVGVTKQLVFIIMFNHYIACGWYFVSKSLPGDTWVIRHLFDATMSYAYFTSLHWSLTQFTPASMEVHPYNEFERLYNIIVIIIAMVIFSSFVSSITNAIAHLRRLNAQKAEQELTIRRYLSDHKISQELSARVWHFVRKMQITAVRKVALKDMPGLKYLPVHVKADLRQEVFLPILERHPLLEWVSFVDPLGMTQVCKHATEERSLMAGEEVFHAGACIDAMFFVIAGRIEYFEVDMEDAADFPETPGGSQQAMHLSSMVPPGEWACEIALWANLMPNMFGSFASFAISNLLTISSKEFQKVCQRVDSRRLLKRYAELFVERFNRESEEDSENILFNGTPLVKEMVDGVVQIDLSPEALRVWRCKQWTSRGEEAGGSRSFTVSESRDDLTMSAEERAVGVEEF